MMIAKPYDIIACFWLTIMFPNSCTSPRYTCAICQAVSNKPSMYRPRSCEIESEDFVKCSDGYHMVHIMKINADIQVQALWRAVMD